MFYTRVSVIPFTGGRVSGSGSGVCLWVQGVYILLVTHTHPGHTPCSHTPLDTHPLVTHPRTYTPRTRTPPSLWSTSGQYASYWNAFLSFKGISPWQEIMRCTVRFKFTKLIKVWGATAEVLYRWGPGSCRGRQELRLWSCIGTPPPMLLKYWNLI